LPTLEEHLPALRSAGELVERWPRGQPLAALVSGGSGTHNAWSVAALPRETVVIPARTSREELLRTLDEAFARTPRLPARAACAAEGAPPFAGGWIVALGYGLGRALEPSAHAGRMPDGGDAPLAVLHWCEDAWCLEHATGRLHAVGSPPPLEERGNACFSADSEAPRRAWRLDSLEADESDAHYAATVARTVEYIRAGDAFQANLARRFTARLAGDARRFAHAAIATNESWFGASIDLPDGGALVSMSPELFLRVRPDGAIATRPIKGTRPASADPRELLASEKDAAELAMIVDLMRNDLGRIAALGSVEVTEGRVLETHSTVHHGVAEIRARIRDGATWTEILAATFPPGSVTGAPKIRAMQIIDELEPSPRGFYCGALGFVSRSGHASLNVAIRTVQIAVADASGFRSVAYHAGCGIVADSDPWGEVAETHAKTRALARLSAAHPPEA
jgi:para-aminobenzoate synthetase component 1